jgi:hypothetical protein
VRNKLLLQLTSAALSGWACHLAVQHATPIDRALPFLGVLVALVAAFTHPAVQVAVPLLIAVEIAIPNETMRLQAFGLIVAAALARHAPYVTTIAAILILRWIPMPELVLRELFLLAISCAIAWLLRATPFATLVAVVTALVTPAIPLRTLALPLAVLAVAALARYTGMPRIEWRIVSSTLLAAVLLFFPWSGIVARSTPYLWKDVRPRPKAIVNAALAPGRSVELDVPHDATALIVSGANVARLRRGDRLGRIEPGGFEVRIGDAADWGYTRRQVFYGTHNPLPRDPVGVIRDYGYEAWVDGASRVALPPGARTIRVTGDVSLPDDASLQVEAFELAR